MALKIKNEEEYQNLLNTLKKKEDSPSVDRQPGKTTSPKRKPKATKPSATDLDKHKKRQGVKESPIMTALRDCSIEVEASPTHISIAFNGARLFTLNEIYAMLQYRSYVVFSYKKQWHSLVLNALRLAGKKKPVFDGPCKVTLFRQGSKKVDRDSLMVMFKYIIDALKHDPKTQHVGVFADDNPDIVYEDEKIQSIGPPLVAIRVDLIEPSKIKKDLGIADLFQKLPKSLVLIEKESSPPKKSNKASNKTQIQKKSQTLHAQVSTAHNAPKDTLHDKTSRKSVSKQKSPPLKSPESVEVTPVPKKRVKTTRA